MIQKKIIILILMMIMMNKKMTLDEAIEHALEKSKDNNLCEECKDNHKQLYLWLLELKEYKKYKERK